MKSCLFLLLSLSLSLSASAQVKFNLHYAQETNTYTISILPEVSWAAPKNTVGAAQVVLRVRDDVDFTPLLTSLVEDAHWDDNAYVEHPQGAAGYTFVCITLSNGPTKKIAMTAGEEVPLFSFVNAGGSCPGLIELLPNDDPMVQEVRAGGQNVTQNLTVLGARGNAFSGIENGAAECLLTGLPVSGEPMVGDVKISPVPASQTVRVRWQHLQENKDRLQMVITDQQAREVFRQPVSSQQGEHTLDITVKDWNSGLYNLRFQLDDGRQTKAWHLMVTR